MAALQCIEILAKVASKCTEKLQPTQRFVEENTDICFAPMLHNNLIAPTIQVLAPAVM